MNKNISKVLVAVMVFSMMLGVGVVKNAYANTEGCTCDRDIFGIPSGDSTNLHFCHLERRFHLNNCPSLNQGHIMTGWCKDTHEPWTGVSAISCCCAEPLSSSGTSITLENSPLDVQYDALNKTDGTDYFADETTNNWSNGQITEEVRVNVNRASYFTITIPKEIVLNGNDGSASYEVSITGELAGDQVLVIKPDATFTLTEDGGKTTPVTVTQNKDTFNYQDIDNSEKGDGTLSASGISAGNWSGKFNFNIEFKAN